MWFKIIRSGRSMYVLKNFFDHFQKNLNGQCKFWICTPHHLHRVLSKSVFVCVREKWLFALAEFRLLWALAGGKKHRSAILEFFNETFHINLNMSLSRTACEAFAPFHKTVTRVGVSAFIVRSNRRRFGIHTYFGCFLVCS